MRDTFVEVTSLPVFVRPGGALVLPRKFIDGMARYVEHWPGPVVALMQPTDVVTDNIDQLDVRPETLPFGVRVLPFDSAELRTFVMGCGLVHWGPHHQLHDLGPLLQRARVPNVYCTEYSLRTRTQIIDTSDRSPLARARGYAWELQQEVRIRRNVARSTGFEANGTPTFDAYASLNPRNLLYFDTRTPAAMVVTAETLEARLRRLDRREPLHLVFTGRLIPMKGALDLVLVASELQRRGVPFRLSICGAGTLEGAMKEQIARRGLERVVTMRGVLPFNDELLPFVREADVFLSCHKQGDPSCTYLETFACGVPMVGYLNEAFAGLLARVDAGWGIPMHDVRAMADVVERLSRERAEIATKARRAAAFARQHTFESTFARRTAFFRECAAIRSW